MADKYWLKPHKKLPLLERMMRALAGPETFICVEGNLSDWQLNALPRVASDERGALKRQTRRPNLDFAVFPLQHDAVAMIFEEISRLGVAENIVHVQIEKGGKLAFGACDNFHRDCVFAYEIVSLPLLDRLVAEGLIDPCGQPEKTAR